MTRREESGRFLCVRLQELHERDDECNDEMRGRLWMGWVADERAHLG